MIYSDTWGHKTEEDARAMLRAYLVTGEGIEWFAARRWFHEMKVFPYITRKGQTRYHGRLSQWPG